MLSNDQCRNYIDSLLNFGLIMEHNNGSKMVYKVTNKGATFLDYYVQLMHLLPMSLDENSDEGFYKIVSYKTWSSWICGTVLTTRTPNNAEEGVEHFKKRVPHFRINFKWTSATE